MPSMSLVTSSASSSGRRSFAVFKRNNTSLKHQFEFFFLFMAFFRGPQKHAIPTTVHI